MLSVQGKLSETVYTWGLGQLSNKQKAWWLTLRDFRVWALMDGGNVDCCWHVEPS